MDTTNRNPRVSMVPGIRSAVRLAAKREQRAEAAKAEAADLRERQRLARATISIASSHIDVNCASCKDCLTEDYTWWWIKQELQKCFAILGE